MFIILLISLVLSWIFYLLFNVKVFLSTNRIRMLKSLIIPLVKSSFPLVLLPILSLSASRYIFLIIMSNFPIFRVPIIFYSYVLIHALFFWIPLISFGLFRDFKGIVAHILPYGAPTGLIIILPLVEIFSQLIRPLTLTIRFATNLSAGHIIIFIFSYFSISFSPFSIHCFNCTFIYRSLYCFFTSLYFYNFTWIISKWNYLII
jgi:F-type H+-transporting ATPase subunit a